MDPSFRKLKQRADSLQRSIKTLDKAESESKKARALLLEALVEAVLDIASRLSRIK